MTTLNSDVLRTWDELPRQAEILIVGGGLAGLELAKHLDLAGADGVLVLEAGAGHDLQHVYTVNDPVVADRLWTDERSDPYFVRSWESSAEPHFSVGSGIRQRLGGRSLYWHGVLLPIEEFALSDPAWPISVVRDLTHSWRDGPSLYARVQADLAAWGRATPSTANNEICVGRFRFIDPPRSIRRPAVESKHWEAYSPLSHWIERSAGSNVCMVPDVKVIGVLTTDGRADGVVVRNRLTGEEKHVTASKTVLAAATVENTRLAIQTLHASEEPDSASLSGLFDHIVQGFNATVAAADLPPWLVSRARDGAFLYMNGASASRSNLFIQLETAESGDIEMEAWVTAEQERSTAGVVTCTPDGDWPWHVAISTGLSPEDTRTVAAQRRVLAEFWSAWCTQFDLPSNPLDFDFDFISPKRTLRSMHEDMRDHDRAVHHCRPTTWASPLGTEEHEGGTLAFGHVIDENHEFKKVRDLFAIGVSIFPRQGAANPSLTTLALARRLAAILTA
ncbi:GMC oxidoreductase [Micromonospora sp. NPDC050686]|uniref:GMC oxidoreductase n=1 Tax=Micromonospora sp. NPDC050686 TaxID=3154631 RepID=UPI0033FDEAF7